jgi:dinuclear metal center YbgI/SA1388 family protein
MHREALISQLEEIAPPDGAEPYDAGRIGLIIEGREEIGRVCCALDATQKVIDEAVLAGADLLVVHHTPLWNPITSVTGPTATLLGTVLSAGLNVYAMHTNYDHAPAGINTALASLLSLEDPEPMSLGLVGTVTLSLSEMVDRLNAGPVRIHGSLGRLERLAVVGGSGFDPCLLEEAKRLGADAFLSAEMKHAVARAAPLPCIESTHYALEAPGMQALAERMNWTYIADQPELSFFPSP